MVVVARADTEVEDAFLAVMVRLEALSDDVAFADTGFTAKLDATPDAVVWL